MAVKPTPDRSDLESKSREDLQTIAKVKGVEVSARATKSALIESIMSESPAPTSNGDTPSRAVRSRRVVATPDDDFEDLLGEFVADAKADVTTVTNGSSNGASNASVTESREDTSEVAPSERQAPRQNNQSRERQPRDFANEPGGRNRRNRRNRNGSNASGGRERFGGEAMPNADQPYSGELV